MKDEKFIAALNAEYERLSTVKRSVRQGMIEHGLNREDQLRIQRLNIVTTQICVTIREYNKLY